MVGQIVHTDPPTPDAESELSEFDKALNEYIVLAAAIKEAEQQVKDMKAAKTELETILLDDFTKTGTQRITRMGKTVHMHRSVLTSTLAGKQAELCQTMKDMGNGALVKESVNYQSLGAWSRELPMDDDDLPILPPELVGIINVFEKFTLRVKAS